MADDPTKLTMESLRAGLARAATDVAAGRVRPAAESIADVQTGAARRRPDIEAMRKIAARCRELPLLDDRPLKVIRDELWED